MDQNNLNLIIGISEIILFVALTVLAIFLIVFMKKFLSSIATIEKEVVEISDKLTPVITDLKFITDDVKSIVDRSRIQFEKIENLSEDIVDKGTGLLNTINKIQKTGNGLLLNTTNLVTAITKGFKTFGNKLKNGSQLQLKSLD
ncbi:MAG: DUF948 domain-containing protein [Bacteroidota bacterium]|nr:DUF948 domain-containing protein [Bacteroidota bacterium]